MNEQNPNLDEREHPLTAEELNGVLLEQSPVAIALFDKGLRCLAASRRWLEEFGLDRQGAIGKSYCEIFKNTSDAWRAIHQRCLAGERYQSDRRERLQLPNGNIVWIEWEINPWRVPAGEIGGLIFHAEIVRQTPWEEIFNLSPAIACLVGLDGSFQHLNPSWETTLGFSTAELLGQPYLDFVHPEDRQATLDAARNILEGQKYIGFENRYRCNDGSYKWLSWTAIPLLDRQQIYGVARDITDRKQAEAALELQRELLQEIIDTTPHWLCVKDWNGRYIMANRAIARAFDTTPENLIGKSMADFHASAEEVETFLRQDRETIATLKEQFIAEDLVTTAAGKRIWLQTVKRPLLLPDTSVPYVLVSATDISQRKQIEEEFQKFAALVANSSNSIGIATLEGEPIFLNPAGLQLLGLNSLEELQRKHFLDFFSQEDRPFLQQHILPEVFENDYWQGEFRFQNFQTGAVIPIDFNLFVIKDVTTGEPLALATITRDISDRKQAEKEQTKLLAIIDSTTDFIGITDSMGFFTYINKAGRKMLGIEENEAIASLNLLDATAPSEREVAFDEWMQKLIRDGLWEGEGLLQCRDGRSIPVSQVAIAYKSETGEVEFLANIARDISDRKRVEAVLTQQAHNLEQTLQELRRTQTQLVQTEKMSSLGQLVAGVAHEINNPVNFIYGNLCHANSYIQDLLDLIQLYQQECPHPSRTLQEKMAEVELDFIVDDLPSLLTSMKVGTERIRNIVDSLRNFSRMDEADMKAVDIHEGIESTLLILQNRLKGRGSRPEIQVIQEYGNLPLIECYAGQLNQVFMNIITNAVDALDERDARLSFEALRQNPSSLRIRTRMLENGQVRICIADNGLGISETIQPRLFDPFFTTKTVGQGTGLGLSISYQIITEKHKGQLEFVSQLGEGTEFIITIPVRQI